MKLTIALVAMGLCTGLLAQKPVIYTDQSSLPVGLLDSAVEVIVFTNHESMVMDEGYHRLRMELASELLDLTVIQHGENEMYLPFFEMQKLESLDIRGNGDNCIEISGDLFALENLEELRITNVKMQGHDLALIKQRYPFAEIQNVSTYERKYYGSPGVIRALIVRKGNEPIRQQGDSLIVGSRKLMKSKTWKVISEQYEGLELLHFEEPDRTLKFLDKYFEKLFYSQLYFLEVEGEGEEIPDFCSWVAWRDLVTEVTIKNVKVSDTDMECIQTVPHLILCENVEVIGN